MDGLENAQTASRRGFRHGVPIATSGIEPQRDAHGGARAIAVTQGLNFPPRARDKIGRRMEPQPASFSLCCITRPKDRFEVFLVDSNAVVLHLKDEKILPDIQALISMRGGPLSPPDFFSSSIASIAFLSRLTSI